MSVIYLIETAHVIRKWVLSDQNTPAYPQFKVLTG